MGEHPEARVIGAVHTGEALQVRELAAGIWVVKAISDETVPREVAVFSTKQAAEAWMRRARVEPRRAV